MYTDSPSSWGINEASMHIKYNVIWYEQEEEEEREEESRIDWS